jgi:hypothetical protein
VPRSGAPGEGRHRRRDSRALTRRAAHAVLSRKGRGKKRSRPRNAYASELLLIANGEWWLANGKLLFATRHFAIRLAFFFPLTKEGRRNADRCVANVRALRGTARADRSALTCRRSTAALAQGSISSQRLSVRPGFQGRGLHGCYPPSPVPVQGSTSHPGHNAGRHDAQAAREQIANPPAGTAPAPPHGLPPEGVLRESGMNSKLHNKRLKSIPKRQRIQPSLQRRRAAREHEGRSYRRGDDWTAW